MIKVEKGTIMVNGSAEELLTEHSAITKSIYEALKKEQMKMKILQKNS